RRTFGGSSSMPIGSPPSRSISKTTCSPSGSLASSSKASSAVRNSQSRKSSSARPSTDSNSVPGVIPSSAAMLSGWTLLTRTMEPTAETRTKKAARRGLETLLGGRAESNAAPTLASLGLLPVWPDCRPHLGEGRPRLAGHEDADIAFLGHRTRIRQRSHLVHATKQPLEIFPGIRLGQHHQHR